MKYLLIINGVEGDMSSVTPEEMQATLAAWNGLNKEMVSAGAFVAGDGLQPSATATTVTYAADGEHLVSDGPFAETKEQIGGYYVVDCANLDEALAWAKKCPVREGSVIEVRPVMDFTGMGMDDAYELAGGSAA